MSTNNTQNMTSKLLNKNKLLNICGNYRSIVFSGGTHKGILEIGAMKYILKNTDIMSSINKYYGTSIGTMVAVSLLLPLDFDYVLNYIIQRPWYKILDLNIDSVLSFHQSSGLLGRDFFVKIFEPLFSFCNISIDITLHEFYEITNKELYLITTELETFSPLSLSYKSFPEMKLIDAIYSSCCIPYIFQPSKYNGNTYLDGGFTFHYPIIFAQTDLLREYYSNLNTNKDSDSDTDIDTFKIWANNNKILGMHFDYDGSTDDFTNISVSHIDYHKNNEIDYLKSFATRKKYTEEDNVIGFSYKMISKMRSKLEYYEEHKIINGLLREINEKYDMSLTNDDLYSQLKYITDDFAFKCLDIQKHIWTMLTEKDFREKMIDYGYKCTESYFICKRNEYDECESDA